MTQPRLFNAAIQKRNVRFYPNFIFWTAHVAVPRMVEAIGLCGEKAIQTCNLPSPAPTTTMGKFFLCRFVKIALGRFLLDWLGSAGRLPLALGRASAALFYKYLRGSRYVCKRLGLSLTEPGNCVLRAIAGEVVCTVHHKPLLTPETPTASSHSITASECDSSC